MSLNSLSGTNSFPPFFPPGIASHKITGSYRRPQSVKECKKLSKNKVTNSKSGLNLTKRLSISSPNIMVYVASSDHVYTVPRHRCDMGLLDRYRFKASPLPQYYSSNSLERNKSLFEQLNNCHKTSSLGKISDKSSSLDRISKKKPKSLTNFVPIRPFYPPSKYPNIQDKNNVNLARLLETRRQYKTPKSRKSLSFKSKNKDLGNYSTNLSNKSESVPNLNSRNRKEILNNQNRNKILNNQNRKEILNNQNRKEILNNQNQKEKLNNKKENDDQFKLFEQNNKPKDYSPEIGLYRKYDKLDLHDEFDPYIPKQMSASYYYPKPIPNAADTIDYDKLAQSLYNESSLAAKIQTGSLERATRNSNYTQSNGNKTNMIELDESPSKSYSPIKQCNSFSQDSLDGTKKHILNQNNVGVLRTESETTDSLVESERIYSSNNEDHSLKQETQTYRFHSPTEDDVENYNKFINSLSTISEKGKTSEDQHKDFLTNQSHINENTDSIQPLNDVFIKDKIITSDGNSYLNYNENSENTSFIVDSKYNKFHSPLADSLPLTEIENCNKYTNSYCTVLEGEKIYHHEEKNVVLDDHKPDYSINKETEQDEATTNHEKSILENEISYNNSKDNSLTTTLKPYKFQSRTENNSNNENILSKYTNINRKEEKTFEDQYNSNRYILDSQVLLGSRTPVFVKSNALSIHNELFFKPTTLTTAKDNQIILDNIASKCIVSSNQRFDNTPSWKKDEIGENTVSLNQYDQGNVNEIDSIRSALYSPSNPNVRGNNYDFNDAGTHNHLMNPNEYSHLPIPRIEFQSNSKSIDESSSENESSLSGSDDTSYMRYEYNSVCFSQPGKSWVSSPELTVARSDIISKKQMRHLQSENPLKPLCNMCFKPAYFMERISINNIIFHKMCFLCRKCDTHLSFNNCIIHRRKPYCLVHAKPKIWKNIRSVSTSKLSQIKEKLDNKSNSQKQLPTEAKQQKRVFYSGIKTAKEKFLQEQSAIQEPVVRQPKRFTPPREGVSAGVLESEPKPRDPNIVTSGDGYNLDEDLTRISQSQSTKERLARFKEIQEKPFKPKDMVNGDDSEYQKPEVISVDTKMLRNKFLSGANESNPELKSKKINPTEEIQELTRKDSNMVYENEPVIRDDVIKSDQKFDEENMFSKNKAKELKDLFSNYASDDKFKKTEKFQMETGEGGVYESNPQERNDDVFLSRSAKDINLPNDSVKTGLQKIKELQHLKSQGYQKSNLEPLKLDMDPNHSGIYENTPAESQVDSNFDQNEAYLANIRDKRYANEAKRAYLEKQKYEEESKIKHNTPQMIDIWNDLCVDSGVFENKPEPQSKDVVRCNDKPEEKLIAKEQDNNMEVSEPNSVNPI